MQSATVLNLSDSPSTSGATDRSLYLKACVDLRIKPNSRILQVYQPHPSACFHRMFHLRPQGLHDSTLELTDCGLRPQDAQALAASLPANTKCIRILLDSNRLGDVGFSALLQVLWCVRYDTAAVTSMCLSRHVWAVHRVARSFYCSAGTVREPPHHGAVFCVLLSLFHSI
jgi:hypothetical protein